MTENEAKAKLERTKVLWESATNTEIVEAVKVAIKALEKQIPKKTLYGTVSRDMACHCPVCMNFVCFADMRKSNYCSDCGQKLD